MPSSAKKSTALALTVRRTIQKQPRRKEPFGGLGDGKWADAAVVMDAAGNLYGTTAGGGDLKCGPPDGCGVVFKLDGTGKETVLHTFTAGADGAYPYGGVILDAEGNLYGTALAGGTGRCSDYGPGCGVVFKVDATGKQTVLHAVRTVLSGAALLLLLYLLIFAKSQ